MLTNGRGAGAWSNYKCYLRSRMAESFRETKTGTDDDSKTVNI